MTDKTKTPKAKTPAPDLAKYQPEINKLVKSYKDNEGKSKESIAKADQSFLALGDELVKIETESKLSKKVFVQLKEDTAEKLGTNDIRNITKVVKVSKDERIKALRDAKSVPANWGWGTLYLLTALDENAFNTVVEGIDADSKVTREDLAKKIKTLKTGNHPVVKKRLIIKLTGDAEITPELEQDIRKLLDGTGWEISEPSKPHDSK